MQFCIFTGSQPFHHCFTCARCLRTFHSARYSRCFTAVQWRNTRGIGNMLPHRSFVSTRLDNFRRRGYKVPQTSITDERDDEDSKGQPASQRGSRRKALEGSRREVPEDRLGASAEIRREGAPFPKQRIRGWAFRVTEWSGTATESDRLLFNRRRRFLYIRAP